MSAFPFYKQQDKMTCGATCLQMIAKYYGKYYQLSSLVNLSETNRAGVSLAAISETAEKIGFRTLGVKIPLQKLIDEVPLPCIAHWNQNHFVVIHRIHKGKVEVADPAHGLIRYSLEEFTKHWVSDGKDEGMLLLLETTPDFYREEADGATEPRKRRTVYFLYNYMKIHRRFFIQLLVGLLAGSFLQLIFPFLTQSIVDIGVQNRDIHFIYLILFAQLMVFFGRTTVEVIRNYILMHVSSRINISLVSDFFIKLMKLPIRFFDTKLTGDIMQRINDNHRIEQFLTGTSLSTFMSFFNFIIFSAVLAFYSIKIFLIFGLGSTFYFLWITFFLKKRAELDFKRFRQNSHNQSKVMELINGMQEIKLHQAERQKRWQWEALQVKLFHINLKSLSLTTAQNSGSLLINELKNIIITFMSAKLVIDGELTLGMMLSISYIIGQLNTPVMEMVGFVQHWQDARLSLERLNEIHERDDEELQNQNLGEDIDRNASLLIDHMSFKYDGVGNEPVLNDLTVEIPADRVTAIVGSSGSGKTTLMKLLLKFYDPVEGSIRIGQAKLSAVSATSWRRLCGVVMQEGYIFNDTIAGNIAVGEEHIDKERLRQAARVSNINSFIETLPLGFNTRIGAEGIGLSTGQKQRILIARAVYKNPSFLFFDEATSALDATNEKIIMDNLNAFFRNKTVVIIAHRLSTVKNADQIIVLEKGRIIEKGNHQELTALKGSYYELVKNQLELGE